MSRFVAKLGPPVNCSTLTKQHKTLFGPTVAMSMSRLVAKL